MFQIDAVLCAFRELRVDRCDRALRFLVAFVSAGFAGSALIVVISIAPAPG